MSDCRHINSRMKTTLAVLNLMPFSGWRLAAEYFPFYFKLTKPEKAWKLQTIIKEHDNLEMAEIKNLIY